MLLKDKTAILYGAAGGIGTGVAHAFAREGARLFLTGRTRATLETLAAEISAAGGWAEAAVVDAHDAQAVNAHADTVVQQTGRLDISFNLIARGDIQGIPLAEVSASDFTRSLTTALTAQLNTAQAAARHMARQGSGVLLMVTSGSAFVANPMMGSTPATDAAMEALLRGLAAELGPSGLRVVGLWTAGVPETLTPEKINAVNSSLQLDAAAVEQIKAGIAQATMLKRGPALATVANTAVFLASDWAASITGTIVNVTCGMVPH
jgi:NAD(P)-dependent dehydrogenase (short-subunit alcohol dehydrogenase family)